MRILTVEQMRKAEQRAIEELAVPSLVLMERAGEAVADAAAGLLAPAPAEGAKVVVVCGSGNNGGDGMVAARHLAARGHLVTVFLAAPLSSLRGDARRQRERLSGEGIPLLDLSRPGSLAAASSALLSADLVVDALLGIGVSRPVEGHLAEVVEAVNGTPAPVVSVDVPSGLDPDTGFASGAVVMADLTVTLGWPQPGILLFPGARLAGEVVVADIGLPEASLEGVGETGSLLTPSDVVAAFPPRDPEGHKGDYGHLLVVAGSAGKGGAAVLACLGALRAGAGLVTCALPASILHLPQASIPEVMTVPLPETERGGAASAGLLAAERMCGERDALAMGPGLGTEEETVRLVRELLARTTLPAVVDADALNALGRDLAPLRSRAHATVLTPHPGEMGRLLGRDARAVQRDRLGAARECARLSGCVTVLKGARTLVAAPDGRWWLCAEGNPGMATAGSGDVLTGMTGALLARGVPPAVAACAAVLLHASAGDLAASDLTEEAMTASDLAGRIGPALARLREGSSPC